MQNKLPFEKKKRKILTRQKAKGALGIKPDERPVEQLFNYGIINIDKPAGPTSHNVSAYVQQILGIKKAGHSGTLDPNVTGCLPVSLGNATKVNTALISAGKEYVCVMRLHKHVELKDLKKALKKFVGKIKQQVPHKAAVKRQVREKEIYYIDLLEVKDREVLFIAGCQAGTYIRMLCHDIGVELKCGAHMQELRRTKAGPFNEKTLVTLNDLRDTYIMWKESNEDKLKYEKKLKQYLLPVETAVEHLPKMWCVDEAVKHIKHGRSLMCEHIAKLNDGIEKDSDVAVLSLKGELICLGKSNFNSIDLQKKKGPGVKPVRVF
ncbi:RNA-guided pseudouridylation complex pseudouridine synthase subunit Cbf5 [Candidatus Woesearchaeota archaeon]|nr:RNA-guided pseudouridylation complex pseudouridine synthase subunit Cbf5 [Candidatus Woesearchaeota archaeon]